MNIWACHASAVVAMSFTLSWCGYLPWLVCAARVAYVFVFGVTRNGSNVKLMALAASLAFALMVYSLQKFLVGAHFAVLFSAAVDAAFVLAILTFKLRAVSSERADPQTVGSESP